MRAAILMLACVLVACSDAPGEGGEQPEGVGDGGVRHDAPQEVRDAIAQLESDDADPSACAYFAAALTAWICIGTDPGVISPVTLVELGADSWGGECLPLTPFDEVEPLCEEADVDEAALYCAVYAATRDAFVCCLEGTAFYGEVLQRRHSCD